MDSAAASWSMRSAYPPMRMVDFTKLERKVVAGWMQAAGVTCDEDYHLAAVSDHVRSFVVGQLKSQASPHRLWVADLIHEEDE